MSDAIRSFFELDLPPVATTLGWRLVDYDQATGAVEIAFDGKTDFLNPGGVIQGGILVAMMDDAMGPAVVIASGATRIPSSIDIHTHFLKPVKPGPITVKARVTQMGKRTAFIEAQLFDSTGEFCARATSSAALRDLPPR